MLADIHCHLDEFSKPEDQIKNAEKMGVCLILTNSVDLKSMRKNMEISEKFRSVKCAFGIHPNEIIKMTNDEILSTITFIEKNISLCSAIGETGLDFKYANERQKAQQKSIFARHIEIAKNAKMPIIVHSRMAREDCLKILEKYEARKVVLHWFVSCENLLKKAISLGYYISIGPSVLFEKHVQEFAKLVPVESVLFETDAPVEYNGKKSEPAWIKDVATKVAEISGLSYGEICHIAKKNLEKLF
ncbi:MAG: TatD family hydrolase [Candidatus Diapherotrites archaeon]|nr:TatD family hydrolase [Candidatus Diapherotrites archaeon]